MGNIFKSGDSIKKVGTKTFGITPALVIINTASNFPNSTVTTNGITSLKFTFNAPTNVLWKRGNGSLINLVTVNQGNGTYVVQFWDANSTGEIAPTGIIPRFNYGSASSRILSFEFDRNLLIGLELYNFVLPVQNFNIPFSEYPNLEFLRLELLNNSITGLNLTGASNSKIKQLLIRASISPTSNLYNVIPLEVGNMPLEVLSISGNFGNYTTSNASVIGTITSLKDLTYSSSFSQSDGLPNNFVNLTNLENFAISSVLETFNITSLPSEITAFTKLKKLGFANNQTALSITQIGFSLTTFPDLEELSLAFNINTFTDFTFINQLQNKIKYLDIRGISNTTRINTAITNLYNLITLNASITGTTTLPYRGVRILLENYSTIISAIPTGTYQQPTGYIQGVSNGTPASSKERIWVLNNQYGCNITYRSS